MKDINMQFFLYKEIILICTYSKSALSIDGYVKYSHPNILGFVDLINFFAHYWIWLSLIDFPVCLVPQK